MEMGPLEPSNVNVAHFSNGVLGPKIPEFYRGRVILITGATGFVGKVLLEKLLRSCPGISQILLVIRNDAKKTSAAKFGDLLNNEVFDRIREECPQELNKMKWIAGDAIEQNLGLSEEDLKRVTEEVSVIFHCAACVRFDGDPKETFLINLVAVKNVVDICTNMKKLRAFVHVSTAYSFCNRGLVSEEIFKETIEPKRIIESLTWMNDDQLKELCKTIVNRPTLYHYSKALAEILLSENAKTLPIVVVRPSVITASYKEPFPGWIDNYNGPTGFIALSSKGIIRTLLVKDNIVANWVPVDIVANTLIAAAYTIANESDPIMRTLQTDRFTGMTIINCVCPDRNSRKWFELINMCIPLLSKYPSYDFYRQPGGGTVTSSRILYFILKLVSHYFPALLVDFYKLVTFRKPSMVKNYNRIHGVMDNLNHYTTHQFLFCYGNMLSLNHSMTHEDKEIFPVNQMTLNWEDYMENYVHGVRKYFLKESDSTLEAARSKMKRYQNIWFYCKVAASVVTLVYFNHRYSNISRKVLALGYMVSRFHVFRSTKC